MFEKIDAQTGYFPINGYEDYDRLPYIWREAEKDMCDILAEAIQLWVWDFVHE